MDIITDLELLRQAAEPLEFITEQGIQKEEGTEIINKMLQTMTENPQVLALSAPQIGINKRIVGIRFSDAIKIFIDPIILKKNNYIKIIFLLIIMRLHMNIRICI